jgi:hypothetical protein
MAQSGEVSGGMRAVEESVQDQTLSLFNALGQRDFLLSGEERDGGDTA